MDRDTMVEENELDLLELFGILRRHILVIILAGVIGCVIGFSYTKLAIDPVYQSWATMFVNNSTEQNLTGTVTSGEIDTSKRLIDTYGIIIKSDRVLNQVIENMNLDISYGDLTSKVRVSSVEGTQIMKVSVDDTDPAFAQAVVAEILLVCPDVIIEVVEAGSVKTISEPLLPTAPISPNTMMNTLILGMLATIVTAGVFLLNGILDTRIKSESDLENLLGVSILGSIPTIESLVNIKKGGRYGD